MSSSLSPTPVTAILLSFTPVYSGEQAAGWTCHARSTALKSPWASGAGQPSCTVPLLNFNGIHAFDYIYNCYYQRSQDYYTRHRRTSHYDDNNECYHDENSYCKTQTTSISNFLKLYYYLKLCQLF